MELGRSLLRRLSRDPIARFVVLGSTIFALHALLGGGRDDEPIVVSSRFVDGLVEEHRARFGRAPSPSEKERLVEQFVREEALVREARELGLDRTDPVVRRRLVQKMELVLRGRLAIDRPTDAEVRRWIAANPDAVARDSRFSFRHAFASRDLRGANARTDAEAWLATLRVAPDPNAVVGTLGDAFVLGPRAENLTRANLGDRFGEAFAEAVESCAAGSVCGPLESRFGYHVLVVGERRASETLPFPVARPIAERAILRDREDAALERAIDALVDAVGVERVRDGASR